jgi:hypothetical protein
MRPHAGEARPESRVNNENDQSQTGQNGLNLPPIDALMWELFPGTPRPPEKSNNPERR